MKKAAQLFLTFVFSNQFGSFGQNCSTMNLTERAEVGSVCSEMVLTTMHDANGLPYLYVANKEGGLRIYDINNISSPQPVAQVAVSQLGSLHVMNVFQRGNYLYLSLGNSFTNPQAAGLAIVDVSNPGSPVVTDFYQVPGTSSGSGMTYVEGDFAYLCAMRSGLVILNIADVHDIQAVSSYMPDINYPYNNPPNPNFYNARCVEVKNGIAYLCFDAGGFRVINCVNPQSPAETGHFANPLLYFPFNLTRAYNNLVIDDSLAYVTVDYCGVEVLDIHDTSSINLIGWWNPQNCPNNNWFTSPVHTNELRLNKVCSQLYVSSGKSDFYVLDMSTPNNPDSCNYFGDVADTAGTWGVNYYSDQIYLSYVCTFGIPFTATYTGFKILQYTPCVNNVGYTEPNSSLEVFPLPATNQINFVCRQIYNTFHLTDLFGKTVTMQIDCDPGTMKGKIDSQALPAGVYFLNATGTGGTAVARVLIAK